MNKKPLKVDGTNIKYNKS